jgi:hypothetical protein
MRDTSSWASNFQQSKPVVSLSVRQRYPAFSWKNAPVGVQYYFSGLGEDWGDSPGTVAEIRERNLPTRYRYGGFVVAGDSVTLSNGSILRCTSRAAGNQGTDIWWREVSGHNQMGLYSTLTFTNPPRPWTGIGLGLHSNPASARLFFIRGTDGRMMYRDYTSGSGFAGTFQYSNTPTFTADGTAIAPISHQEGFVITYNPTGCVVTLHYFTGSTWFSYPMPMRFSQHPLNCHWFDAVPLGSDRLVTFNVNGVQYATLYNAGTGFRDPWPVMAFDPEFGGAQTRICKLTKVGNRVVATAWSRFAGSSNDYDVSYYHLLWTDDGINWATPEEGYIGRMPSRGKLHTQGDYAYIIGTSLSYWGAAVAWLGGTAGVHTSIGNNVVGHNLIQDLDKASDAKLPLLIPDSLDKSLLTQGNELVYGVGPLGDAAINISTLTLDTPGSTLEGNKQVMQMVCRGPLKRLIGFRAPMDQTLMGAESYHADFTVGSLYARAGTWSHETAGVAYCERHDGSEAVTTVGVQYSGQFQITTRLRITKATDNASGGVVFWYEGPQDYWRVELSANAVSLRQYDAGNETIQATYPISLLADAWCDVLVRYAGGYLTVWVHPSGGSWTQAINFSGWTSPEPLRWYAGLFCVLPNAKTTQPVEFDATHAVHVSKTTGFPVSGEIQVNSEIIAYSSKTGGYFGTGEAHSLARGVRSTRMNHPTDSPVFVAGRRFEADRFSVFQDGRAMSVADACAMLVTSSGTPFQSTRLVDNSTAGVRVFPELHGHSWVVDGEFSGTFSLYFWTNTTNPPLTGIRMQFTLTEAILSELADSAVISNHPIALPASGTFRCQVTGDTIMTWINGRFFSAFQVPGKSQHRVGAVGCNGGVTRLIADELFEPSEGVLWAMKESARDVLQRLLDGRDAYLRERSDGSVQVTLLEKRDDLGELTGQYFVVYQQMAADQEWASALIAWGAEEWVMVMEPNADRLRWAQWQTPHIYDRATLRHRAMRKLRKLWALKDLRTLRGPFDPRIEVGDEVSIASIRGIPSGRYLVKSMEVIGEESLLDMQLTLQALPDDLVAATWPIKPGVDRPTEG